MIWPQCTGWLLDEKEEGPNPNAEGMEATLKANRNDMLCGPSATTHAANAVLPSPSASNDMLCGPSATTHAVNAVLPSPSATTHAGNMVSPDSPESQFLAVLTAGSQESRFSEAVPQCFQESRFLVTEMPGSQESRFLEAPAADNEAEPQSSHFSTLIPPDKSTIPPAMPAPPSGTQAPTSPTNLMPSIAHLEDPTVNYGADPEYTRSRYTPGTGYSTDLLNANNVFNKIYCYLMLWQTTMLWSKARQFAYNCYQYWNLLFLCADPGKPAIPLHWKEGFIQGDVFRGHLFVVTMMPLCTKMRTAILNTLQPWYANDAMGSQARYMGLS